MLRCLPLLVLLTSVQGGPYVWKPRAVARPLVAKAQWKVHHQLLRTEARVLQDSLDISRLAQATTQEAFRLTDEARARLDSLVQGLKQEVKLISPVYPECNYPKRFKKAVDYMMNVTEELYRCTHSLSDKAAAYEVDITLKVTTARTQVWDVERAMWYCQKKPKVDKECLARLLAEGLEIVDRLPDWGRMVRDAAQAEASESLAKLGDCFAHGLSRAEERQVSEIEKMRRCVDNSKRQTSEDVI